jgi:ribonuclease P protein component
MPTTFRRDEHIRRRRDFQAAYDGGVKVHGRLMSVFVRRIPGADSRLGIAATRKIGGAVLRNRAKRLTRELFRRNKPTTAMDLVVVPRRELLDAPFAILEREFTTLIDRALNQSRGASSPQPRRGLGRSRAHTRV